MLKSTVSKTKQKQRKIKQVKNSYFYITTRIGDKYLKKKMVGDSDMSGMYNFLILM